MGFSRITSTPHQCGGVPCLRSLRIPVATVLEMIGDRMTTTEILAAFPDLVAEDVEEALRYAAAHAKPANPATGGRVRRVWQDQRNKSDWVETAATARSGVN